MRIVYFIIISTFTFKISKNQGLSNSLANISHENLLDNPWFTINQRGQSSFPSVNYAYWMDRWKLLGKNSETIGRTITLDDGISVSAGTGSEPGDIVCQVLEKERFQFEKVYTLSVMLDDGKVYSVSGILPTPDGTYKIPIFTVVSGKILIRVTEELNKNIGVIASAERDNISFKIKAMKLELGSVSTLSMDSAPNYQQELAKCQRYFVRFNPTDSYTAFGAGIYSSNHVFAEATLPTVLRAKPSVSFSSVRAHSYGRNDVSISSITVNNYINNIVSLKCAPGSGANFVNGDYCELQLDINNYLDLSCDL